jgi:uracil-DNA glycosylase
MYTFNYLDLAIADIHPQWNSALLKPEHLPTLEAIDCALHQATCSGQVIYPPREHIFHSLHYCAPADIKVVILGQDPYHGAGEAMGLSFSVPDGVRIPPSLRNIFKEQLQDLQQPAPSNGNLTHWAQQGVLLLNSVLTVEADKAGSHGKLGWQDISNALIDTVNQKSAGCVFLLWGNWAKTKMERIDSSRHLVLTAAHPSPLSASRGFLGCRHFSAANQWLQQHGSTPINW